MDFVKLVNAKQTKNVLLINIYYSIIHTHAHTHTNNAWLTLDYLIFNPSFCNRCQKYFMCKFSDDAFNIKETWF